MKKHHSEPVVTPDDANGTPVMTPEQEAEKKLHELCAEHGVKVEQVMGAEVGAIGDGKLIDSLANFFLKVFPLIAPFLGRK